MQTALYTVTNRLLGKRYVGITKEPGKRWNRHKSDARCGSEHHFHRAIRLHGEDSFDFQVQQWFPTSELAKLAEQTSICFSQPEYNSTAGGDGTHGHRHTDGSKQLMRAAKEGKPSPLRGRPKSEQHRAKLSATKKGKPGPRPSDETRAKLSAAQKGNTKMLGKTHSAETIAKMRAAATGRKKVDGKWVRPENQPQGTT